MRKIVLSIVLIVGLATIIIFALNFDTTKIRIFILETKCNNRDAESCFDLGNLYYNGEGVERDYKKAMEYFGIACDLGKQKGCDAYKKMKLNP
ncbi:tetratricopeptide repeat protein [Helicobacter pullorum]|uniref:tetratricopeptide repeat protein n=1 Tax=Helicobacter pullorum TaxID=35818 RepID=UPI00255C73B3|nr:hypothetical protein [Helicobacter pullorum]